MFRIPACTILFALLGFSMSTQADTLGPLDGRSPDPSQMSAMSVEVGYITEDEFTTMAGRLNYQYSPVITLYGDFGMTEIGDFDGNAFGAGVRYHLPNQRFLPQFDVSVRASYHISTVEHSSVQGAESDLSEMAFALHFGGKEAIASNGLKWYGVLSYNRLGFETSAGGVTDKASDSELGYGGGVYMPLGPGEIYVGIENIEDMYMGIGYRHFLGGASY